MFDWFKKSNAAQLNNLQSELPASAGLKRDFAGHPSRGLTPARLAQIMQQAEYGDLSAQAELFMDMEEKDAHLSAELNKRRMAVTQLDWELRPARDASAREKKATERLELILRDELDINNIRADMLDAIGHGYACLELEWGRTPAGLRLPTAVMHRPPTWFQCPRDDRGTLNLRDGSIDGVPLQPFGWLPHIHKSRSGYLPRIGLHRVLAWPYLYKNYSVRDLAEFLEVYGLPIRLGKYPAGADVAQRQALLDAVLSIGHHAAGIIPDTMQVDINNAMTTGNADGFRAMIEWCEAVQSKAILGGTLTSQTGANGNRSLGNVHNEVRLDIRNDDASQIDRSLSNYLIYPIAVFNGLLIPGRTPDFVSDTQEPEDLALYADALPKLVAIGARISRNYINNKLKIPEPEEGEEVLGVMATPALEPPPAGGSESANPNGSEPIKPDAVAQREQTEPLAADPDRDPTPVAALTETMARATGTELTIMVNRIRDLIDRAETLDDVQTSLLHAYGDLDSAELTRIMAAGFALAELRGLFDVTTEAGRPQ